MNKYKILWKCNKKHTKVCEICKDMNKKLQNTTIPENDAHYICNFLRIKPDKKHPKNRKTLHYLILRAHERNKATVLLCIFMHLCSFIMHIIAFLKTYENAKYTYYIFSYPCFWGASIRKNGVFQSKFLRPLKNCFCAIWTKRKPSISRKTRHIRQIICDFEG